MIREEQALAVRSYLSSYMEPDEFAAGKPDNSYEVHTLYLDSNQLATYHAANNGEKNRFKLRIRYYDDNPFSPVAFEIKRRINVVAANKSPACQPSSKERKTNERCER